MEEWVEALRIKLQDMRILSPHSNIYTRSPEQRQPLLPTRDPTSPLPATPPIPPELVPGVEPNLAQRGLSTEIPISATSSENSENTE